MPWPLGAVAPKKMYSPFLSIAFPHPKHRCFLISKASSAFISYKIGKKIKKTMDGW
jgi:hypothetical protein